MIPLPPEAAETTMKARTPFEQNVALTESLFRSCRLVQKRLTAKELRA